MQTANFWPDDELSSTAKPSISALAAPPVCAQPAQGSLPAAVEAAVWRGDQLGSPVNAVLSSGFAALDAELPGGGWPCGALTEILTAQFSILEWRLLAPALSQVGQVGRGDRGAQTIVVVGPPKAPHVPGLRHDGIDDRQLVWIKADTPAERLWSTEQLIKSNAFGALIAWLPQVRQEQIRRLQVLSAHCQGPVFLCRPVSVASESSAAPLRVHARVGMDWELHVEILKRKGPPLAEILRLESMPGGLKAVITPRLRYPSRLLSRETDDVVVSAPAPARRRLTVPH